MFLRSMGHEFRAPLDAILGLAERIGSGKENSLSEVLRKDADGILTAGRHLGDLLAQVDRPPPTCASPLPIPGSELPAKGSMNCSSRFRAWVWKRERFRAPVSDS